jgi:glycolate oxidase FAD binding subunit
VKIGSETVIARLESVLGARQIDGHPDSCARYAVDGVVPVVIAKPLTADEVAEVVHFAKSENLAVIPCGRRSKLGIGMPPTRYDIALDMTGLNQIAYYDPADLTLSVDAGMGLGQLAEALGAHQQFVPLAVPFFDESTVGGAVASGIDSLLQPSYGSARDFLLGAEFVNGAGTLTKSGGRVVKNVTGYDLHKALIGSLGTLAAITRLNFRTFPSPAGCGHVVASFSMVEGILRFRKLVAESALAPSSLVILGSQEAQRVAEFKGDRQSPLPEWFSPGLWHICVSFEGTETVLRRYAADLRSYAQQAGATDIHLLEGSASETLKGALRELLSLLPYSGPATTIFKMNVLPALPSDVQQLRDHADRLAIPCSIFVNSSGALYFVAQPADLNVEVMASLAQLAAVVFDYAAAHHGQPSILFCPVELKQRVNVWGAPRKDAELMRRVKKAFDPQNVFAPGRFVAGI